MTNEKRKADALERIALALEQLVELKSVKKGFFIDTDGYIKPYPTDSK